MGFPTFEHLCRDICKAVQVEMPIVAHDDGGNASLSMQVDGVNMTIVRDPLQEADAVLVLAELGPVPADCELPALLALLDANFLLRSEAPMSFGCSPERGDVVLQSTYRLGELSTQSLCQSLIRMSELAHQWRSGHFLDKAGHPAAQLTELPT